MMNNLIKKSDAIEAIEVVDWYHQNKNKDMVSGANSDEHQAWYKADDVYKALEAIPPIDRPQGEWVLDPNGMDWNIPAWRCSRCGFVANYIGVEVNRFGRNPMNWSGSKYCPNCGCQMRGADDERV